MDRRALAVVVAIVALTAVGAGAWTARSKRAMTPERLERKLASHLCKRVAECEPERWEAFHRSFDRCIAELRAELGPTLAACPAAVDAGRACIGTLREASCGAPWTLDRLEAECPTLASCP